MRVPIHFSPFFFSHKLPHRVAIAKLGKDIELAAKFPIETVLETVFLARGTIKESENVREVLETEIYIYKTLSDPLTIQPTIWLL